MAAVDTTNTEAITTEEFYETAGATEIALTKHEWNRPWKAAFLQAYALTGNISSAARAVDISRAHVYLSKSQDAVFAAAMAEAREVGTDMLEAMARKRVTQERVVKIVRTRTLTDAKGRVLERETVEEYRTQEGASDGLVISMLKANRPEVYGDKADIRVGGGDAPIKVEITRAPDDQRLLELVQVARELGAGDIIDGDALNLADDLDAA
jgi:molybdenum-dependent DNA-binding transcriptional regulator ModE